MKQNSASNSTSTPLQLNTWRENALKVEQQIRSVVIGQERSIHLIVVSIFARGHVLLEGDVGVGKTTLLRAFARAVGGNIERIEGTVDLLPSDLLYHTYISENGRPVVDRGPILKHGEELSIFFFNEINRARPQVHSMMLRVMAERSVTAFNTEYRFPHLQVFADRNRMERDETYEVPAAARDRFLMEFAVEIPVDPDLQLSLMTDTRFHDVDVLIKGVDEELLDYKNLNFIADLIQQNVHVSKAVQLYALNLCTATRKPEDFSIEMSEIDMSRFVQSGASPRGMSMLIKAARVVAWLHGRDVVLPEDVRDIFPDCIKHRIFFTPVYEMHRSELASEFVDHILQKVSAP